MNFPEYILHEVTPDQTERLQARINEAGPGLILTFAPGAHRLGALRLRSDMTVELAEGAELAFEPDYGVYASNRVAVTAEDSDQAMIYAKDAKRLVIKGAGVIRGGGVRHFTRGEDKTMGTLIPSPERPRMLVMDGCRDVTIMDLQITDSPMWTLHAIDCQDVTFRNLKIDNDLNMPNTDGIVIDACQRVTVTDCTIRTADDGVVLKTSSRDDGRPTGACSEVTVSDCTIQSRSCALKIGTESFGSFSDITFERIRIDASNRGMGIMSRDGGDVDRVRFRHIRLDCRETPDGFWGSGEALTINTLDRNPKIRPSGHIRDVLVEDISGQMEGAINVVRAGSGDISGVVMRRVALSQQPGQFGTGGSCDLRPTALDQIPTEESYGRKNAWRLDDAGQVVGLQPYTGGLPGIFAKGTQLVLEHVRIKRPNPLPAGWGGF